jgi:hypothetical protein
MDSFSHKFQKMLDYLLSGPPLFQRMQHFDHPVGFFRDGYDIRDDRLGVRDLVLLDTPDNALLAVGFLGSSSDPPVALVLDFDLLGRLFSFSNSFFLVVDLARRLSSSTNSCLLWSLLSIEDLYFLLGVFSKSLT